MLLTAVNVINSCIVKPAVSLGTPLYEAAELMRMIRALHCFQEHGFWWNRWAVLCRGGGVLFFLFPRQRGNGAELCVPADSGSSRLQEADNTPHQTLNRQFQAALPFLLRTGVRMMPRWRRQRGGRGEERRDPSPPADALFIPQRILCYM